MSTVEVLFFAADPLSAPPNGSAPRLQLDEEVRQIRMKLRGAEHRDRVSFDSRWAVRTDDLLQALNEKPPHVVHFSGHGGSDGLILVGKDGRGHAVDAAVLKRLFTTFRGDIKVVVLNACYSQPQAEAIKEAVGCAIGTRGPISDEAAITFASSFYRAIAFGKSVKEAFAQAETALALEHVGNQEWPELLVRDDVDPAQLYLVGVPATKRPRKRATPSLPANPPPTTAVHPEPPAVDPQPPEPAGPAPAPGPVVGPSDAATGQGTAAPAGPRQLASLGLVSPPPQDYAAPGPAAPAPRAGWEWIFVAAVWGSSVAGAMLLGVGIGWALGLSLVPLLIAAGLMRYARSSGDAMRRGPAAGVAVMASAAAVLGGAALIKSLLPDEHSHEVQLAVCAESGTARTLGLLGPSPASRAAGVESGEAGELADAKSHYDAGDHASAFPAFYGAAEAGNAEAMSYVGTAYLCGQGTEQKLDSARYWLSRAQDRGSARAMFALGVAHETGQGFQNRSQRRAKSWYRKAAVNGYVDAMRSLGRLHSNEGAADSALVWYEKAAGLGSLDALVDAGHVYEEGRLAGGPAPDSAVDRYRTAARQGLPRGMFELGRAYQEGIGVRKDYAAAKTQYERAAAAGSADAKNNLGVLYQNGWGVPPNRERALQLYREAAQAGSTEAERNLAALDGGRT